MSSGDGVGSEVSRGRGQETGARLSWTRSQMTFHSVCPPQLVCTRPGDSQLPGTPAMSASLSSQPWSEHQWDRGDCPLVSPGISHAPTTFPSSRQLLARATPGLRDVAVGPWASSSPPSPLGAEILPRSCSHMQFCLCPRLTYLSGKS